MSGPMAPPMVTWRVPGTHRNPQAIWQGGLHQLVESDTTINVDNGGLRVDGVNVIHRLHVNDQAASVLGRVTIGAAHASGDHTPLEVVGFIGVGFCHQGNRTSNLFHVRGGKHLGGGGGGPAQPVSFCVVVERFGRCVIRV